MPNKEYNNKDHYLYYYPNPSELRIGYRCETKKQEPIGEYDSHVDYFCFDENGNADNCFLKHKEMVPGTVPYLVTAEDIVGFQEYIDSGASLAFSTGKPIDSFRVKNLDQEDIMDLGWVFSKKGLVDHYQHPNPIELDKARDFYGYRLWQLYLYHYGKGKVRISGMFESSHEETLFDGECKSINELETVMKLLKLI